MTFNHLQTGRFQSLDGLRGVAALMVVFYHFNEALLEGMPSWNGTLVNILAQWGYLGVDVFFVISGAVISYSVTRYKLSIGFIGRFILRRSLRLDPPYWATILAELCLLAISLHFFADKISKEIPTAQNLLLHVFYLQEITGSGSFLPIFWTLCLEVQFYLVFVLGQTFFSIFKNTRESDRLGRLAIVTSSLLFLLSILESHFEFIDLTPDSIFLGRWYQFFLGYLAMRAATKSGHHRLEFAIACLIPLSSGLYNTSLLDNDIAALAAAIFIVLTMTRKGSVLLTSSLWQFLGRVSYSLYLIHLVIGWRLIQVGHLALGYRDSLLLGSILLVAAVLASVFSAWLLYLAIESPSVRLAKSVKMTKAN